MENYFGRGFCQEPYESGQFHYYKSARTELSDSNESSLNLTVENFLNSLPSGFMLSSDLAVLPGLWHF